MSNSANTTESSSHYRHLDKMSTNELLTNINKEDQTVALSVQKAIPVLTQAVDAIVERMAKGGRMFYIGAGTSGRLGILDASELPPTYGVPFDWVVGLIAGGDAAIRKAQEFAEDDVDGAWKDMAEYEPTADDIVLGIAASGRTPYVIGGLEKARSEGLLTIAVSCNENSKIGAAAEIAIDVPVGPEFVTGSTRMKSGTAQKLILNMISTSVMIKLGRVIDNKMVDMQLSNNKLVDRGTKMVIEKTDLSYDDAKALLLEHGSVRAAVDAFKS